MYPITVGPRDLVLFAGLPGAGKSTLLGGLRDTAPLTVRDSDQVREMLRAALPGWLPYRAYRPLVHLLNHLRVLVAVLGAPGPVLVHDPATRLCTRIGLALLARLSGRPAVFLWLDVTPLEALNGQRARGRLIPPRSFARHVARADLVRQALLAGAVPPGWERVVFLDRAATCSGLSVAVRGPVAENAGPGAENTVGAQGRR